VTSHKVDSRITTITTPYLQIFPVSTSTTLKLLLPILVYQIDKVIHRVIESLPVSDLKIYWKCWLIWREEVASLEALSPMHWSSIMLLLFCCCSSYMYCGLPCSANTLVSHAFISRRATCSGSRAAQGERWVLTLSTARLHSYYFIVWGRYVKNI
jgi:hypothetical protein